MVDTIKFSEFNNGGDLENDETTVGLDGGVNTRFNNPWTFLRPGTTGDRPTPAANMYYRQRFNTTLEVYEYYDPTTVTWTQLSGSGTGTVNPGVTNDIAFYAANGQAVSPIASLANAVLRSNGSGVPSMSTTLPSGLSIPGAIITASTAALTAGSVVAAPAAGTDLVNKTYADALFGAGVASATGTTNQVLVNGVAGVPTSGAITLSLPQDIAIGSTPTFAGLTLSSIPLNPASGGTGINNGSSSLTLAGSLATIGAFASNFTMTGITNVTFPTSGTLLTSASAVTSLAATANQTTVSAATGAVTTGLASNAVLPGTGGVTLPQGNTAARAGGAGTIRFNTQSAVFESTVDGVSWAVIDTSVSGDVDSIIGTANQIQASNPTGNVTLFSPILGNSGNFTKNLIIGGDFGTNPWQRGTTFTAVTNGQYTADRWTCAYISTAVANITRSSDSPTVAQAGIYTTNSMLSTITTADTSIAATDIFYLAQIIEGYNYTRIAQRPFTLSFWVKSNITGIFCVSLISGGNDRSYVAEYTINSSNTWEYKTISISAPPSSGTWDYASGRGIYIIFTLACGSNFYAIPGVWNTGSFSGTSNQVNAIGAVNNTFQLALVQVEPGSFATPFEIRDIQRELAMCQRYFCKTFAQGLAPASATGVSAGAHAFAVQVSAASKVTGFNWRYPVNMRTAPSTTYYNVTNSGSNWYNTSVAANSGPASNVATGETGCLVQNVQVVGDLINNTIWVHATAAAEL